MFLAGSVLCGVAWSMPTLIIARAVQGIGAGAVLPMTITVVGDLYSVEERARVQGYVASVWGAAAVDRPDPRRAVLRVPQLAVDLLRQHPARRRLAALDAVAAASTSRS